MFSFDKIIGNAHIIKCLQNSICTGKISHAYIFSGQAGLGKKLMANSFAKTLQCDSKNIVSCNNCVSCSTVESGNHPDVFYVRATKTKSIGVDDIREQINHHIEIKPYKYPYKIFIIEGADTMTVGAQNALLKTIEEPPSFGVFLLLAENTGLLLSTIISRCVTLKFKPLTVVSVSDYLKNNQTLGDKVDFLSNYSQGNIGKALALANDDEFINMREHILNILITLNKNSRNSGEILSITKEFEKFKERIFEVLDIVYFWYRDIYVAKAIRDDTEAKKYFLIKDKSDQILKISNMHTMDSLYAKLVAINTAMRQLKQYANFSLVIDVMLLELSEVFMIEGEST